MEFSLFYFANDSREHETDRYRLLLDGARFADRNGFSAVWTPERHFHPFGGLYPNPSVTSAAVATVTERVHVRAGSVVAALHHPLRIAEEWSVVDNLSNGRAGVSFASGWNSVDFALVPDGYSDRWSVLDERIDQVRRLWRGEKIPVVDGAGNTQEVGIFPPPVQPRIPVWVTSGGRQETFQKAGHLGAGVLTHLLHQSIDGLASNIRAYHAALAARNQADGWAGHITLMLHTCLGEREDEIRELVRRPMLDYLRGFLDLTFQSRLNGARAIDPSELQPSDIDVLVERAFERFFVSGSLLGTVGKALGLVEGFRDVGVDELACLIDFGAPQSTVLAGLEHLNLLRKLTCHG